MPELTLTHPNSLDLNGTHPNLSELTRRNTNAPDRTRRTRRTRTHPNAPERTRTHPNVPERTRTNAACQRAIGAASGTSRTALMSRRSLQTEWHANGQYRFTRVGCVWWGGGGGRCAFACVRACVRARASGCTCACTCECARQRVNIRGHPILSAGACVCAIICVICVRVSVCTCTCARFCARTFTGLQLGKCPGPGTIYQHWRASRAHYRTCDDTLYTFGRTIVKTRNVRARLVRKRQTKIYITVRARLYKQRWRPRAGVGVPGRSGEDGR